MPEVIEVKEYTKFIYSHLRNKKLYSVKILKGRYKKAPFEGYYTLKNGNYKLVNVNSKGKFMYMEFKDLDRKMDSSIQKTDTSVRKMDSSIQKTDTSFFLGVTLGLSGGWFFKPNKSQKLINGLNTERFEDSVASKYLNAALKHINVEFVFSSGILYFYDQLSFGTLKLFKDYESLQKKLDSLGVDMGDSNTTFEDFKDALLTKPGKSVIGNLIVNQKVISGVGNYLRADALWASKISPFRKLESLSNTELKKLYNNIRLLIFNKKFKKSDRLPSDYDRGFWIYKESEDIYGNPVYIKELYTGSQKRFIYYTDYQI